MDYKSSFNIIQVVLVAFVLTTDLVHAIKLKLSRQEVRRYMVPASVYPVQVPAQVAETFA